MQVKASGGVRDLPAALAMVAVGATRLGTSSSTQIVQEARAAEAEEALVVPADPADLLAHARDDAQGSGY